MRSTLHLVFPLFVGLLLTASGIYGLAIHWPSVRWDDFLWLGIGALILFGAPQTAKERLKGQRAFLDYVEANSDAKQLNLRRRKLVRLTMLLYALTFALTIIGAIAVNHRLIIGYWLGGAAVVFLLASTLLYFYTGFIKARLYWRSSKLG